MAGQTRKLKWSLDDLDLTKPIEPLSRFIDEPEKLIDEVFKIAAQYLPKDIVPSSLKDIPTVELKKLCLEQLKKVERKTLLNILTDGSNELEGDVDQSGSNLNETKESIESIASGSGLSRVAKDAETQVNKQEKDKNDQSKNKKIKRSKQESTSPDEVKKVEQKTETRNDESLENSNLDSILDQAALEIRELELRAQAIRELLKKHEDADNANQVNVECQKEFRKRQRVDSTNDESINVQKEKISNDKPQDLPSNVISHRATEQRSKEVGLKTKVTSRLSRNPVSMVEEDEPEDLPTPPTNENDHLKGVNDKEKRGTRRKRSADETNMMIELNADSDDSIDRELKGE